MRQHLCGHHVCTHMFGYLRYHSFWDCRVPILIALKKRIEWWVYCTLVTALSSCGFTGVSAIHIVHSCPGSEAVALTLDQGHVWVCLQANAFGQPFESYLWWHSKTLASHLLVPQIWWLMWIKTPFTIPHLTIFDGSKLALICWN